MKLSHLKTVRKDKKISIKKIVLETGMSRVTLWRIENGKCNPDWDHVVKLTEALGLTMLLVDKNSL